MPKLVVLLPCFNEAAALPGLLRQIDELNSVLSDWDVSTLVVDDGSTDDTAEVTRATARTTDARVVSHAENSGLGAALATGVREFLQQTVAPEHAYAVLAVMDGDGTHEPALLEQMLVKLEDEQLDVVIASRFAPGGREFGLSTLRRLYSHAASAVMRRVARLRAVSDYSCGYRVYRRAILARAMERYGDTLIRERGFTCMVELLVKLARCGARFGEVGMELHYERKQGASKMRVAATIRRYVAFTLRLLFNPQLR